MSVSLWRYNPEQCDGDSDCCGDCDYCNKEIESEEEE